MDTATLYNFSGKTVFITGAAVALADMNLAAAEKAAKELKAAGRKALALQCDVADENAVAEAVAQVQKEFGGLDMAYNNAGIHAPVAEIVDADGADFDRVLAVNLKGIWNCMKHELRIMREAGSGVIVNSLRPSGLQLA